MHAMKKEANHHIELDIGDVSNCACATLRKTSRAITQSYDDALRPFDLRTTQFTLLATLDKTGDVPLTKLAKNLGMDRTTLTRNLKPLIRRQMVMIENETDQRVRNVSLTNVGKQAVEQALPHWQSIQHEISQKLGSERWTDLLNDLNAMASVIEEP